jgi:hypothetical protein
LAVNGTGSATNEHPVSNATSTPSDDQPPAIDPYTCIAAQANTTRKGKFQR